MHGRRAEMPWSIDALEMLLARHDPPCLSLFMPTHRRHNGAREDAIRFGNLLVEAERLLGDRFVAKDIPAFLGPVRSLSCPEFWRYQLEGLAVFRSCDLLAFYRIPEPLRELLVVADTFHLKPLVAFLESNRHYFVLCLSQNAVRLYQGTAAGLDRVEAAGLPASRAEALGAGRGEKLLTVRAAGRAGTPGIFHGHGGPGDQRREDLRRFCRAVDDALWPVLRDEQAPLVLAGVDAYHAIYRQITRYRHLVEEPVEGNVDRVSPEDLHARAWPVACKALRAREDEALGEFGRLVGRGLAIDELRGVARAAMDGRIRTLLVAKDTHVWGRVQPDGVVVEHDAQQDVDDDDVLDDLVEAVLIRGGGALVIPADRMPTASPIAAILRW